MAIIGLLVRDDPREENHCSFVGSCPVSTVSRHVPSTQKEHTNIHRWVSEWEWDVGWGGVGWGVVVVVVVVRTLCICDVSVHAS